MDIEQLNKVINYIEDNLTEKIDYRYLASMVGLTEQLLNKVFIILLGISIPEYIRKRRLSRAYEELKNSDIKVLDLALKYQYESDISFTRAFKLMFEITPSDCRNSNQSFKIFPVAKFSNYNSYDEFNFEIVELDEKEIYCLRVEDEDYEDFLYKIRKLYKEIENTDWYMDIKELNMIGISIIEDNKYKYYLGSENKHKDFERIIIPKGKYIMIDVGSREQNDIKKMYKAIYEQLLSSTSYDINMNFSFELYKGSTCAIYIMLNG